MATKTKKSKTHTEVSEKVAPQTDVQQAVAAQEAPMSTQAAPEQDIVEEVEEVEDALQEAEQEAYEAITREPIMSSPPQRHTHMHQFVPPPLQPLPRPPRIPPVSPPSPPGMPPQQPSQPASPGQTTPPQPSLPPTVSQQQLDAMLRTIRNALRQGQGTTTTQQRSSNSLEDRIIAALEDILKTSNINLDDPQTLQELIRQHLGSQLPGNTGNTGAFGGTITGLGTGNTSGDAITLIPSPALAINTATSATIKPGTTPREIFYSYFSALFVDIRNRIRGLQPELLPTVQDDFHIQKDILLRTLNDLASALQKPDSPIVKIESLFDRVQKQATALNQNGILNAPANGDPRGIQSAVNYITLMRNIQSLQDTWNAIRGIISQADTSKQVPKLFDELTRLTNEFDQQFMDLMTLELTPGFSLGDLIAWLKDFPIAMKPYVDAGIPEYLNVVRDYASDVSGYIWLAYQSVLPLDSIAADALNRINQVVMQIINI